MHKCLILAISLLIIAGCENKPLIECQTKNDQLENDIVKLEEKLEISLKVIDEVDAKHKAKIDQLNNQLASGNAKQAELNDALATIKAELNNTKMLLNKMDEKYKSLVAANEKSKSDLAAANNSIADLTGKLKQAEEQQNKSKLELDQAIQKLNEAENKLKAAQSKVEELTKQVEVLQKEKAELLEKLSEQQKTETEQQ